MVTEVSFFRWTIPLNDKKWIRRSSEMFYIVFSYKSKDYVLWISWNHLSSLEVNKQEGSWLYTGGQRVILRHVSCSKRAPPKTSIIADSHNDHRPCYALCQPPLPRHTNLHGPTPTASPVLRGLGWQTDLACPLTVTLMHWGSRD